jgi:hypothetical protein
MEDGKQINHWVRLEKYKLFGRTTSVGPTKTNDKGKEY